MSTSGGHQPGEDHYKGKGQKDDATIKYLSAPPPSAEVFCYEPDLFRFFFSFVDEQGGTGFWENRGANYTTVATS